MTLTPDEQRLLELYRKAKRRRLTLHVVCMEAVAKIYLTRQEEAVTVGLHTTRETRAHQSNIRRVASIPD